MNTKDSTTPLDGKSSENLVFSDKRILIVDDEPLVNRTVATFLNQYGYQNVECESDARNAINVMREFKPDMLLLDIKMPHLSGFELLQQISENHDFDNVVVLMLSAAGQEEEQKSYELGALGFIPKPVKSVDAIRIISSTFRIADRFGAR